MENNLSESEQRVLLIIVNNPNILRSSLSRKMHGMKIKDQNELLNSLLIDHNLIYSKLEDFKLGKRGRRSELFYATSKGKALIKILTK